MILKTLRYTALSIIFLILVSLAAMQIKEVKLYAFSKLSHFIEKRSGYTISIDDLELMLPFEVKFTNLKIESQEGNSLDAGRAVIRINPSSLLDKKLQFHSIRLVDVSLNQVKSVNETDDNSSQPVSIDFEQIPFYIAIPQFYAQNLVIHSEEYSEISERPVDIEAHLVLDPDNKSVSLGTKVVDHSDKNKLIAADIDLLEDGNNLIVDMKVSEAHGGFLNLPEDLTLQSEAHLIGTIDSWNKLLNEEASAERVLGDVHLEYSISEDTSGELKGNVYLSSDRGVEVTNIESSLGSATITGDLFYHPTGRFDGSQLSISIPDIANYDHFVEKAISGPIEVSASLTGTLDTPSFQFELSSEKLEIDDTSLANVDMELKGTYYSNTCLDTQFELNIDEPNDQIHLSSIVRWCMGDMINIQDLRIVHPSAKINGDLTYSMTKHELDGSVTGNIDNLRVLENFMPYEFQGQLGFDAMLSHDQSGGQSIDMNIHTTHASIDSLSIDNLTGVVSISDAYQHPDGLIELSLQSLHFDDAKFENIQLTSHINERQKAWPFEISFGGNTVEAKGDGFLEYTSKSIEITLDALAGAKAGHKFNLIAPITLHFAEDSTTLSPLTLDVENGFLQATLKIEERKTIESSLKVVDIPLSFFSSEIYSQPFDGIITANVDVHGSEDQIFGTAQADLRELTFTNIDQLGSTPTKASLEAKLTTDGASFTGILTGPGGTPIDVKASLPIKLMLRAPMVYVDTEDSISITLNASGPITPIVELFAAEDFVFSGEGDIQVDVTGSLASPSISGKASVFNGALESFVFGTLLKNIEATFEGDGPTVKITSLSASDHKDGRLEGAGYFGLLSKENYPFALNLNLANLRLVRLDNTKAAFNGELSLAGNSEQIDIKGNVESTQFDYKIAKKIDEITETVEVTYINQNPNELPPTKIYKPQLTEVPTNIDLNLKVPRGGLVVTDDDLSSSWGGEINVGGKLNKLKLKGEIKLDRGDYLLNGQMWDLTNGSITMAGDPEKKTSIYTVASRDINDYRVDIVLRGKLTNPNILLRSSPALPQQEILSLILFGEAPTEITYMQDQQLEQSLSSLTKDQSGPGALSKIQKTIGIDRIDINRQEVDDHEEMSIQIGKYITKDIYISLNKGFGDEPTRVAIEAKLRKNLKLQVDAGESSRGSDAPTSGQVSLLWKHDY